MFKRLGHINNQLYRVELAMSEVDQKEPNIVGFFFLQYAQLRKLELYYVLLQNCVIPASIREMDADSLYLALAGKNCMNLYEVRKSKSGKCYAAKTVRIRSLQTLAATSFPDLLC